MGRHTTGPKALGSGPKGRWFLLEKPRSVVDAELSTNAAFTGNALRFVSQFRIESRVPYLVGTIYHGPRDLARRTQQVYVEARLLSQVHAVGPQEVLPPDGFTVGRIGHA